MPSSKSAKLRKPRVFTNYPTPPRCAQELFVAVRDNPDIAEPVLPGNPTQYQVNLGGTRRALRELGRYLIALSELDNGDPEPYHGLNNVRNHDGGTIRLILRRVENAPRRTRRTSSYKAAVCGYERPGRSLTE
jgi:hypothetical protein